MLRSKFVNNGHASRSNLLKLLLDWSKYSNQGIACNRFESKSTEMQRIQVIDSHTGGEPTRIVIDGGPDLGSGSMAERVEVFRNNFDEFRSAVVNEPRGSDVLIGGLLCEPTDSSCSAAVIFFNTAAYLGMCGHGTMGLLVTLKHLGRLQDGEHRIETPVGMVTTQLEGDRVSVQNVASYRHRKDVVVEVPGYGTVVGDIAWGGNWFFCITESPEESLLLERVHHLTEVTLKIRDAMAEQNITGPDGQYLDHIELYGPPTDPANHRRNFVLCPGGSYDRSPCGTGTSAKLSCLAEDGKLAPGEIWRQESIVGSVFECSYQLASDSTNDCIKILPTLRGSAHISGESTLILDPADPFCMGIRV